MFYLKSSLSFYFMAYVVIYDTSMSLFVFTFYITMIVSRTLGNKMFFVKPYLGK